MASTSTTNFSSSQYSVVSTAEAPKSYHFQVEQKDYEVKSKKLAKYLGKVANSQVEKEHEKAFAKLQKHHLWSSRSNKLVSPKDRCAILDTLNPSIAESTDRKMIELFSRAVSSHNMLCKDTQAQVLPFCGQHLNKALSKAPNTDVTLRAKIRYPMANEELAAVLQHNKAPCCQWEAGQSLTKDLLGQLMQDIQEHKSSESEVKGLSDENIEAFRKVLQSKELSPLAIAQLLEIPDAYSLVQGNETWDLQTALAARDFFQQQLATALEKEFSTVLESHPSSEKMAVCKLRKTCLSYLCSTPQSPWLDTAVKLYFEAKDFPSQVDIFQIIMDSDHADIAKVMNDFHEKTHQDKALFAYWLAGIAGARGCTIEHLKTLETAKGYDSKNAAHVRAVFQNFIENLSSFHEASGEAYSYILEKALELDKSKPPLSILHIARPALKDFAHLPKEQQERLRAAAEKVLKEGGLSFELRSHITKAIS